MKKTVLLLFAVLLCTLTGCQQEQEPLQIPADEILLVSRYVNYAWGYDDQGDFIDSAGGVYSFDFSQEIGGSSSNGAEFLENLQVIRQYAEPYCTLDSGTLQTLYQNLTEVDASAEFQKEHAAYDAGEQQLLICQPGQTEMILCQESGDYDGSLQDSHAKRIAKLFDGVIEPQLAKASVASQGYDANRRYLVQYTDAYEQNQVYFYRKKDTGLLQLHCGYMETAGRYVLEDEQQAEAFQKQTGIRLSDAQWTGVFPSEYFVYFVEIQNVPDGDYDLKTSGMLCKNGAFTFVPSPESIMPPEDSANAQMTDSFCFVEEIPKALAVRYQKSKGVYAGLDGQDWNAWQ